LSGLTCPQIDRKPVLDATHEEVLGMLKGSQQVELFVVSEEHFVDDKVRYSCHSGSFVDIPLVGLGVFDILLVFDVVLIDTAAAR
jgi:hypothetical protein